jgi:uncharacterized membrane protein (DUF106 family)
MIHGHLMILVCAVLISAVWALVVICVVLYGRMITLREEKEEMIMDIYEIHRNNHFRKDPYIITICKDLMRVIGKTK